MKIYLGSDHAGYFLKEKMKSFLLEKGYEVVDCGAYDNDKDDDYPVFVGKAADAVSKDPASRGIVFGGSGQGEAIVANKYKNVRCALFYALNNSKCVVDVNGKTSSDPFEMLRLAREHNDANMLSLGARLLKEEDTMKAVQIFLETPFSGEERHMRRVEQITQLEEEIQNSKCKSQKHNSKVKSE
ncbi:RpiB/LacA/LacB family sugar-phosphate isomerase [Patescibacteria group bacterium]|nr:RpiB/LacA/LacB family sugar-phosphate isomerase [Patescibacteria group bacterium]